MSALNFENQNRNKKNTLSMIHISVLNLYYLLHLTLTSDSKIM